MNKKRQTIDGLASRDATQRRRGAVVESGDRMWGGEPRQKTRIVEEGSRAWGGTGDRRLGLDDGSKNMRGMNELGITGVEIGVKRTRQKAVVKKSVIEEAPRRRMAADGGGFGSPDSKIEAFLEEIKDEDPTNLTTSNDKKLKKKRKNEKKAKTKEGKKKRHVVRWVVIGVILVIVGLLVWKGAEMWGVLNGALGNMTGGNVGIGDIIGADPTVPLKQDDSGRTNILVFGTSGYNMDEDARGGDQLADTIMVVSLDQEGGNIKTLSIPRDLVSKTRCTSTGKMNETYWCEYQKHTKDERYQSVKDNSEELAGLRWEYEVRAGEKFMSVISDITGLQLHYWVHANWETMIAVVDAIGEIEVAIEYEGDKDSYTGDLPVIWTTDRRGILDSNWDWACKNKCNYVKYANGTVAHLDGVHAIALARARGEAQPAYGTAGSNWNRERNQQAILDAIVRRVKQTNFVTDLNAALDIIRALGDNLRMSFDAEGIRRGIYLAGEFDVGSMQSIDISSLFTTGWMSSGQTCERGTSGCASVVVPRAGIFNYTEIAAYISKNLVSNPIEEEGAVIDVLNGTEQTGLAAKVSQEMKDVGYTVGVVGNTPEGSEYAVTAIYGMGKASKPGTEKKLVERFGVEEIKTGALPQGVTSEADFVVILGRDYASRIGLD